MSAFLWSNSRQRSPSGREAPLSDEGHCGLPVETLVELATKLEGLVTLSVGLPFRDFGRNH